MLAFHDCLHPMFHPRGVACAEVGLLSPNANQIRTTASQMASARIPWPRGASFTCKAHRPSLVDLEDLGECQRVPVIGLGPLGPELDAFQGVLEALPESVQRQADLRVKISERAQQMQRSPRATSRARRSMRTCCCTGHPAWGLARLPWCSKPRPP